MHLSVSGVFSLFEVLRVPNIYVVLDQKTLGVVRCIVGPPLGTGWSAQWHDILHEWNMRVDHWSHASGISSWSKKCMTQYWNFAFYIANLPAERWVRRTLAWQPRPTYPPRGQNWDAKIGNVLQVQGCVHMGNCCEKCGPMGLSFAVFPGFELHVVISSTFSERCLYLVQFLHFWLYVFLFSASAVTLGSPALELTRAFMYYGSDKYICRPGWPNSQVGNGNQVVVV